MKPKNTHKYRVVDLFAGAGGLSCGFLQTERFEIVAAFENNAHAQKTYRCNHNNIAVYDDVADAITIDLGKVDVVIGGPPCQGFSNANRQKNHAVSQNNYLVKRFVKTVLHLNPMAFVMENVSMLKSNIHRFYVDKSDEGIIEKYKINTESVDIHLLDSDFIFDGVENTIINIDTINRYLWENENDYLSLNTVYRMRKNIKKMKASLEKHKKKLLALAVRLVEQQENNDKVVEHEINTGKAIKDYFASEQNGGIEAFCKSIEPTIMFQRMFSKAKEIQDYDIIVSEYSCEYGLIAKVESMAVIDYIESILSSNYNITQGVMSAAAFGVPQKRMRFVVMGVKKSKSKNIELPNGTYNENSFLTVENAIKDIEDIAVSFDVNSDGIQLVDIPKDISDLGRRLRGNSVELHNHVSTATTPEALERFKTIQQGENFHSLDPKLKASYSDPTRTQNTIYLRLRYNEPSGTVVNVRKSMWIHPILDRALSIREAARLQTFPDSYIFYGPKDAQYQQVGNAVPPILAEAIAIQLSKYLDANTEA